MDTRTWKVQKVTFNSSTTFNGASFSLDGLTLYIGTHLFIWLNKVIMYSLIRNPTRTPRMACQTREYTR